MDFVKIIRSVEEFLYEAMTWLFFYPRTLWRCLRHPDWTIVYTGKELGETPGEQFTDLISPPLFLIISIGIAHGIGLTLGVRLQDDDAHTMGRILQSPEQLLIFRTLIYSIIPLVMAAGLLQARGTPIDRDTLRSPFYLQCYLTAPFALGTSSAVAFLVVPGATNHAIGGVLMGLSWLWFVTVQTRWFFNQIEQGWWRAFRLALRYLLLAWALIVAIILLLLKN